MGFANSWIRAESCELGKSLCFSLINFSWGIILMGLFKCLRVIFLMLWAYFDSCIWHIFRYLPILYFIDVYRIAWSCSRWWIHEIWVKRLLLLWKNLQLHFMVLKSIGALILLILRRSSALRRSKLAHVRHACHWLVLRTSYWPSRFRLIHASIRNRNILRDALSETLRLFLMLFRYDLLLDLLRLSFFGTLLWGHWDASWLWYNIDLAAHAWHGMILVTSLSRWLLLDRIISDLIACSRIERSSLLLSCCSTLRCLWHIHHFLNLHLFNLLLFIRISLRQRDGDTIARCLMKRSLRALWWLIWDSSDLFVSANVSDSFPAFRSCLLFNGNGPCPGICPLFSIRIEAISEDVDFACLSASLGPFLRSGTLCTPHVRWLWAHILINVSSRATSSIWVHRGSFSLVHDLGSGNNRASFHLLLILAVLGLGSWWAHFFTIDVCLGRIRCRCCCANTCLKRRYLCCTLWGLDLSAWSVIMSFMTIRRSSSRVTIYIIDLKSSVKWTTRFASTNKSLSLMGLVLFRLDITVALIKSIGATATLAYLQSAWCCRLHQFLHRLLLTLEHLCTLFFS